ncbi:thiazole biosynthesis protein ThiJ [Clostridia bacterium]|nr:thiazole biosynthesis protein ThiJ [Clostridia bacterium]
MANAAVFYLENFEVVEALAPVDVLRRGGVSVTTVSLGDELAVRSSHGVTVTADKLFSDIEEQDFDILILPGGAGTEGYMSKPEFLAKVKAHGESGGKIGAICAAPSVIGRLELLRGKKAVCFPGYEKYLEGAEVISAPFVTDGNVTTGRGAGVSVSFALELLAVLTDKGKSDEIKSKMQIF